MERRIALHRVANLLAVIMLASALASCGGASADSSNDPVAAGPALSPVAAVGRAPTITIVRNHFVDGQGREIRLLGVNFAGVEGACVQAGFQEGATDAQPGAVFDYQGPDPVIVPGQPPQPAESFFGILAAWHVNAVRFMVNEKCWLGGPPNPKNNPAVAPIPQARYDSAQ